MESSKMKAIVATGYGNPDVLEFTEVVRPTPGNNEVLVKIYASSATRADSMMRTGKPYFGRLFTGLIKPKHNIPGTGFSGEVVEVGGEVTRFKTGDKVFGETTLGFSTNAEFVVVGEEGVILHKPDSMEFGEASTYCDGHLTSINFLREVAQVQPGQKVLINGASGSLGTAAVQIAKVLGAEVTAVCSSRNTGLVRSLGADHIVDYTIADFTMGDEQYDVVYDTVGKSSFGKCKRVLKANGKYVSPVLQFSLMLQMLRTSITGGKKAIFAASGLRSDDELRTMLRELVDLFLAGKLKTIIDRQYPLEKVALAHAYIDEGHKKGNVVIMVQS